MQTIIVEYRSLFFRDIAAEMFPGTYYRVEVAV